MNILVLSGYIFFKDHQRLSKNKTGFGHMVGDIAESFAVKKNDVSILTHNFFTSGEYIRNIKFVSKKMMDFICIPEYYIWIFIFRNLIKNGVVESIRLFLKLLTVNHVRKTIRMVNPNVVNIHGLGIATIPFIIACIRENRKFVITLHGLNSFSDSIKINKLAKKFEKRMLKLLIEKAVPITVISTGIKNKLEECFSKENISNISVITNGVIVNNTKGTNIRKKYGISENDELLLCVGNISINKNQTQVIRAMSLVIKKNPHLILVIIGRLDRNIDLDAVVHELGISSNIIITGEISREEVYDFYKISDYNITASIEEGFGLPIVEAFCYGIPTVCFSDLCAIDDVYSDNAMILVYDRSDIALCNGIIEMIKKEWSREFILNFSKKFTMDEMSSRYIDCFGKSSNSECTEKDILCLIRGLRK